MISYDRAGFVSNQGAEIEAMPLHSVPIAIGISNVELVQKMPSLVINYFE